MIIWLNGAYGSGKSSVSEELHKMISDSFIYNPENAGNFIRDNFPNSMWEDDFQDYPIWREINYKMITQLALNYSGTIIVPMTVIKSSSYRELVAKLESESFDIKHFILSANEETLLSRLLNRGEKIDSWCVAQIDRCLTAFENDIKGIEVNTDNCDLESIVNLIYQNINTVV